MVGRLLAICVKICESSARGIYLFPDPLLFSIFGALKVVKERKYGGLCL